MNDEQKLSDPQAQALAAAAASVTPNPVPSETATSDQPALPQVSAGALLRQLREAAGLHMAALAFALKVPVSKLEALEADRLDLLPDVVFARALASSVCRSLKADPSAILDKLPQTTAPQLKPDESGINVPYQAWGSIAHFSLKGRMPKTALLAALLLLLGVLTLAFLPWAPPQDTLTVVQPAVKSALIPPPVLTDASPLPPPVPAPEPVPEAASPPRLPPSLVQPIESPPIALEVPTRAPVAPPVLAPAVKAGLLTFQSSGTSWIEVIDAAQEVRVRRNLEAGESLSVSGVLPLSVVVGNVQGTQVFLRGKPFDLTAVSRENVAHFEVK
jgi:cytoskeleton protein RodZ